MSGLRRWTILLSLLWCASAGAAVVHQDNFIPDASRTNFNGFEGLPAGTYSGGIYTEDGITVANIEPGGGFFPLIATQCVPACFSPNHEGDRSWYPNSSDNGYTRITRSSGTDFVDVDLLVGSGFGQNLHPLAYQLLNNGVVVQAGQLPGYSNANAFIGFSGGGFDEIRLRNGTAPFTFNDGSTNALAVDSIELIPEPSTWVMLFIGFAALASMSVRRRC